MSKSVLCCPKCGSNALAATGGRDDMTGELWVKCDDCGESGYADEMYRPINEFIARVKDERKQLNAALSFFVNFGEWKTIFVGNRMNQKTITLSDDTLNEFRKLIRETNE